MTNHYSGPPDETGYVRPQGDAFDGKMFVHRDVDRSDLDVYEYRIYGHLVSRVGSESRVWPRQTVIAAITGVSLRQVGRALASLEEKGWIRRQVNTREDGSRSSDSIWVLGSPRPPLRYEPDAEELAAIKRKAGKASKAPGGDSQSPGGEGVTDSPLGGDSQSPPGGLTVPWGVTDSPAYEVTPENSNQRTQTREDISASQGSAAPSTLSAFKLRPKKKALPPSMSHLAQGVAPKAPRGDQEAEQAAESRSESQSSGAAEPDDYLAPWEQPEEPAPARVAPEPTEQPAAPQKAAKRPAAPSKKSPRKEPKYPPGVMKAMTDAVMEGAYPEGGVPASKARLAGVKAAELLDAGYAPEDIPEIVEFLKRDPFWRNKITPGVLVSEAPRWKSATAKRRAASTQQGGGLRKLLPSAK